MSRRIRVQAQFTLKSSVAARDPLTLLAGQIYDLQMGPQGFQISYGPSMSFLLAPEEYSNVEFL